MPLPVHDVVRPALLDGQTNGNIHPDRLLSLETNGRVATLLRPATPAWYNLCTDAANAGHILVPFSTYRSYERQKALFLARYSRTPMANTDIKYWDSNGDGVKEKWYRHTGATTAAPGTSNHGWGLAVDIRVRRNGVERTIDDAAVSWLIGNAHRHGFSAEIQSEPWHWRYYAGDKAQPPQEDDVDEATFKQWTREVLNEGTGEGRPNWAATSKSDLKVGQDTFNIVRSTAAAVARLAAQPAATVNVAALAAEMVDLMDDDLAAAVANELSRRLGD